MATKKQNIHHEFLSDDQDTIIALCTPRGQGAIALFRLSGNNAISITDRFARLSSKKTLQKSPTHTIHHGHIIDTKETIIVIFGV